MPHNATGRRCFQMRLHPFCLPLLQIVKVKVAEWSPRVVAVLGHRRSHAKKSTKPQSLIEANVA